MLDVFIHISKFVSLSNYCKYRKQAVNKNDNDNVKMTHGHTLSLQLDGHKYFILKVRTGSCVFPPGCFVSGRSPPNTEQWTVQRGTNWGEEGEEPAVAGRGAAEPATSGS